MMAELVAALVNEELGFEYNALFNEVDVDIFGVIYSFKVNMGEFLYTTVDLPYSSDWKVIGRHVYEVMMFIRALEKQSPPISFSRNPKDF